MENRNQSIRLALFTYFCLTISGCGSDEAMVETTPGGNPNEIASCETLEPRVLEAPLTGGAFHCLWCNQEWRWTIPADTQRLFVLVALDCESLRSEAYLETQDSRASVVWHQEIEQGNERTYCIRHESPPSGTWSIGLRGTRNLLLAKDLIQEFRGSIYLKVFNEQGDSVMRPYGVSNVRKQPWP